MARSIRTLVIFAVALTGAHVSALPQGTSPCPSDWLPTFGGRPGTTGPIHAFAVDDDGSGTALYAGGAFSTAGGVEARDVARWNGSSWAGLGNGVDGTVKALVVYDDGSGAALYAGGEFDTASGLPVNGIAKWDGSAWSALSNGVYGTANSRVTALAVFDDGSGPALYAGGEFTFAGGVFANGIARWNGSAWSPLGVGGNGFSPSPIEAMTVFDDGGGAALFVSGGFTSVDGVAAKGIARWDGTGWSALGSGLTFGPSSSFVPEVGALTVFDDGSGQALYAGGEFSHAGGIQVDGIARWNGSSWSGVGPGLGAFFHDVQSLIVFDDGSGPTLYAGGYFGTGGPGVYAQGIVKWDGTAWPEVGGGLQGAARVHALAGFDDGGGSALFAGGDFTSTSSGVQLWNAAQWDGAGWSPLGNGLSEDVHALTLFDDGMGTALYAGGRFDSAGGQSVRHVAKWNGTSWSPLGDGTSGPVHALAVFDDGGGQALYAGGDFAGRIVRWNGSTWTTVGGGTDWQVYSLATFDDGTGPALYVGGVFSNAGGMPASRIAKWDGTSWSALGSGIGGVPGSVRALAAFDDGTGPALYAGGLFTTAGGLPASNVARWNGTSWTPIHGGVSSFGSVAVFHVHDDGGGAALYMAGLFSLDGGATGFPVARWNGATWSEFGTGIDGIAYSLASFDDGNGSTLYAGGQFSKPGLLGSRPLARWNGSVWSQIDGPQPTPVRALATIDSGTGRGLYVGGRFTVSPGGDSYLARWGNPCPSGAPYCFGDGVLVACPCGNHSGANDQSGCLNSLGLGGKLDGTGHAVLSADSLVLSGTRMPDSSAMYFQGSTQIAGGAGAVFGDGLRCAGGTLIRLGSKTNVGGASHYPGAGDPSVSSRGLVTSSGVRAYQVLYRNAATFCTSATFNLTNGLIVVWAP